MNELSKKSQAEIGKRNRRAGNSFQRKAAKQVANAFGWNWKEAFDRAGAGIKQSHDALTLSPYSEVFPFWWECKYRQGWNFHQFFKNPDTAVAHMWFQHAVENTVIDNLNPALIFSAPNKPVYWMCRSRDTSIPGYSSDEYACLHFQSFDGRNYSIWKLEDFLEFWKAVRGE